MYYSGGALDKCLLIADGGVVMPAFVTDVFVADGIEGAAGNKGHHGNVADINFWCWCCCGTTVCLCH